MMPTGASENDLIEYLGKDPEPWVAVRSAGCHLGVRQMWGVGGTWKRWPILIDSSIVSPTQTGLQLVEGRTRVGVSADESVSVTTSPPDTWPGSAAH